MKEVILKKTAIEYFSSAQDEFKKNRFNSAVVLYFKALIACADLLILKKLGKTPSSHTERFRITQENLTSLYEILDKDFPFYQDSYIQIMSKEIAEVIKEDAESIALQAGIKLH